MRIVVILAATLTACGVDCAIADRDGVYLMETETVSGDCGPQNSSLVRLNEGDQELGSGCRFNAPDELSEDECKLTRDITCDNATDDLEVTAIAVTEQEDSDGDKLSGVLTMTVRELSSGDFVCSGTYNVTATRQ